MQNLSIILSSSVAKLNPFPKAYKFLIVLISTHFSNVVIDTQLKFIDSYYSNGVIGIQLLFSDQRTYLFFSIVVLSVEELISDYS